MGGEEFEKMKLEVGMYVRGNYYQYRGKIGKIIKNYNNELEIAYKDIVIKTSVSNFIDDNWDINGKQYKASYNIIDLIEVGDYVNGYKVSDIYNTKLKFGDNDVVLTFKSNYDTYYLYVEDIESIVTKEQFESMKYIVERDD